MVIPGGQINNSLGTSGTGDSTYNVDIPKDEYAKINKDSANMDAQDIKMMNIRTKMNEGIKDLNSKHLKRMA